MYVTDRFVYVDLNKTGTVSVINWLKQLGFTPESAKHHQKPPASIIGSDRLKFATIRDPWSFYLSLWSYGCKSTTKSGPYNALTRFRPFHSRGVSDNFVRSIPAFWVALAAALRQDWVRNRDLYADLSDSERFRAWLRVMHDPSNAALLSGSYHASGLHRFAGLYTYRYCRLYCRDETTLHSGRLRDPTALAQWECDNRYIDEFLVTNQLAEDFTNLMQRHALAAPKDVQKVVGTVGRMNASRSQKNGVASFYDADSIDLVARREALIVSRFGFEPAKD